MPARTPEEVEAILARVQAATDALPRHELPGFFSWAAGHPGVVNYRTKDAAKYDADQRRAYFLEQAESEIGPARTWANHGMARLGALTAGDNMRKLKSAYEPYASEGQMLGEDHPAYNLGQWMQSLPSSIYATGQMAANAIDPKVNPYPDAPRMYAKSVNTLGLGLPGRLGILPEDSRWKDLEGMRGQMARPPGEQPAWRTLDPSGWEAAVQASRPTDLIEGRSFLKDAGVPEGYANIFGDFMDATIDPLTNLSAASKLSRLGQTGAAMKSLGIDYGLGTAGATVPRAMDAVEQIREFLNRQR